MSERSLVAITGVGGSGKTNLARGLHRALDQPDFTVDHISMGEYVREQAEQILGRGTVASHFRQTIINHLNSTPLEPFDPDIALGIAAECLQESTAQLILLDGFPRFRGQVEQLFELSIRDDVYTRGAIITYVNEEEAVERMTKRKEERTITNEAAYRRYEAQRLGIEAVRSDLLEAGLPHVSIDTYHPKERTLVEGFKFIERTLPLPGVSYPYAS
ncbi:MAG: adenylate kinase [Candidatus Saccharibacteria bacterium]|nr:adenylate kinase [Candidatus Saccharibacteria bacterium]